MENLASEVDLLNLSSMDVSDGRLISNDRRILSGKTKIRNVGRIFVSGYDTNLQHDDVERALRKLFSPCGQITDICIRQCDDGSLISRAIIYLIGEDEYVVDKALLLSGSDVGGWNATVEPYPFPESAGRRISVYVTGYDTSLSEIDIGNALCKHFSSCGKTRILYIAKEFASAEVRIHGEDAQDKAMELDGSDMGGRKLLVKVTSGGINTVQKMRLCRMLNREF
ncbi:hypothetical protein HA466_0268560 [Hirschfeldia incana]|nr:hypothetical protein HA466_0268560 [Hirschfeldia incana]